MTDMYLASLVIGLISFITSLFSSSENFVICAPIAIVGGIIALVLYYLGRKNTSEKSVLGFIALIFSVAAISLALIFFAVNLTTMSRSALNRVFDWLD